jgi:hypothetical protein
MIVRSWKIPPHVREKTNELDPELAAPLKNALCTTLVINGLVIGVAGIVAFNATIGAANLALTGQ